MGNYRFFSRRDGWGETPCKHYISPVMNINDDFVKTNKLLDKSSTDILEILTQNNLIEDYQSLYTYCIVYDEWYLYDADKIITSMDYIE